MSAQQLVRFCTERGLTIACAESLTAGLVSARIADVPGASMVLRGGVVTYATDLKASLLGVSAELLAEHGPVHAEVARQMAVGVARLLGADLGLATTGVAGPGPADGFPAGTVHVAVVGLEHSLVGESLHRELSLTGDRPAVREGAVQAVLALAVLALGNNQPAR